MSSKRRNRRQKNSIRPRLEALEPRIVPANFDVSSIGGLISAIQTADGNSDASNTITLAPGNYTLKSGAASEIQIQDQPASAKQLIIAGGTEQNTIIAGGTGWKDRLFEIMGNDNLSVRFQNLTLTGGVVASTKPTATAQGGAMLISGGNVTLSNVAVSGNKVSGAAGTPGAGGLSGHGGLNGGKGGDAEGGGIYLASGSLTLNNATVSGNSAQGGKGGSGGAGAAQISKYAPNPTAQLTGDAGVAGNPGDPGQPGGPGDDGKGPGGAGGAGGAGGSGNRGGADAGGGGKGGDGQDGPEAASLNNGEGGEGGDGGAASGGGIYVAAGQLSITNNSTISGNTATGGSGGKGGAPGQHLSNNGFAGGAGGAGGRGGSGGNVTQFTGQAGGEGGEGGEGGAGGKGGDGVNGAKGGKGGDGGEADGGGVYVAAGTVTVVSTTVKSNAASGGNGGKGADGGDGGDGGNGAAGGAGGVAGSAGADLYRYSKPVPTPSLAFSKSLTKTGLGGGSGGKGGNGGEGGEGGDGGDAEGGGDGGDGGDAKGGGFYIADGTVSLVLTTFTSNSATGGQGADGGNGGKGGMGGAGAAGGAAGAGGHGDGGQQAGSGGLGGDAGSGGGGGKGGEGGEGGDGGNGGKGLGGGIYQADGTLNDIQGTFSNGSAKGGDGGNAGNAGPGDDGGNAGAGGAGGMGGGGGLHFKASLPSVPGGHGGNGGDGGEGGEGGNGGNAGHAGNGGDGLGGDIYVDSGTAADNGTTFSGAGQGGKAGGLGAVGAGGNGGTGGTHGQQGAGGQGVPNGADGKDGDDGNDGATGTMGTITGPASAGQSGGATFGAIGTDTKPPTTALNAPNIDNNNKDTLNPYTFTVAYSDPVLVKASSISGAVVQVQPPSGSPLTATVVKTTPSGPQDSNGDAQTITVTYQITPPTGSWEGAPTGDYTVNLVSNAPTDLAGNAAVTSPLGKFTVNTSATAPTVTGVSSTTANGTYGVGATISIAVGFSDAVTITGTPKLALNSGGTANYSSGSGTNTLTFTYVVAAGQNANPLDEASATALTLSGGTITNAGNAADLTLPAPGTAGSLGVNKTIIIDTTVTAPTVTGVTSTTANGTYGTGATISIAISFSEAVTVTGTPGLALNSGGTASYSSGSGTNTLTFTYVVGAGQNANPLDEASTTALTLNGGTITNAGNAADLTLPAPGTAGSLGVNKTIIIDTSAVGTPIVTGISPNSGPTGGGTGVTISGSNFTGATAVHFGGTAISPANFIVNGAGTSISVNSPPEAAGTVDVTVTTAAGTSATVNADTFTYVATGAPTVTKVAPNVGPIGGGTSVTITGNNFTNVTAVKFGGVAAKSFQVSFDGHTILAVAPHEASGTVDVTVANNAGTSPTGTADQFTYVAPGAPLVTRISPSSGPTGGGTSVTIHGNNLAGVTAVFFGGVKAQSFAFHPFGGTITAVAPAGTGTVDVTVVTAKGTSPDRAADQFTYLAAGPLVTDVSPASGPLAGGNSVTLSGHGFLGASAVHFGTVAATQFTVNSDSSITVMVPGGLTTGPVDVTVTTSAGTSATGAADVYTYSLSANVTSVSVGWGTRSSGPLVTAADGLRLLPADRSNDLPWLGINQIVLTFDQAVALTPGDIRVTGVVGGNYGPVSISRVGTTDTYIVTLAKAITGADRVTLSVGNGDPAITAFTRRLDVLPGDVNDDGRVNNTDAQLVLEMAHLERPFLSPTLFADINGDGKVNIVDFFAVLAREGSTLLPV